MKQRGHRRLKDSCCPEQYQTCVETYDLMIVAFHSLLKFNAKLSEDHKAVSGGVSNLYDAVALIFPPEFSVPSDVISALFIFSTAII